MPMSRLGLRHIRKSQKWSGAGESPGASLRVHLEPYRSYRLHRLTALTQLVVGKCSNSRKRELAREYKASIT